MDPVKCPDCGVWWRGETHRCSTKDFISCPLCGRKVADYHHHTCKTIEEMREWRRHTD